MSMKYFELFTKVSFLLVVPLVFAGCTTVENTQVNPAATTQPEEVRLPLGVPLEDIEIFENERNEHRMFHEDVLAAEYASAGDVVLLEQAVGPFPEGALLMFFNDTTKDESKGMPSFGMVYSLDDGLTWSDRVTVPIESNLGTFIAADASVVQQEDGSLLVYFYALDPRGDHNKERVFYAASSQDGLSFVVDEEVYRTQEPYNSPDVVFHDGQWYLFLNIPEESITGYAVGDSPYDFGELTSFLFSGITGVASNGSELLLADCTRPMKMYRLEDGLPKYHSHTSFQGCVPSPYFDENGELRMVSQR